MIPISVMSSFSDELVKIAKDSREKELWEKLKALSPVPVEVNPEAELYGGGYFDPDKKYIGLSSEDRNSLAHEIGHAILDQSILGKAVQHPIGRAAFPWTPIAGALGGVLLAKGKKMGLLLPVVTASPTLLSESLATGKGSKKLREAGATDEEIKEYRKALRNSYSTYAGIIPEGIVAGALGYLAAAT
jgi:hypothetical protein